MSLMCNHMVEDGVTSALDEAEIERVLGLVLCEEGVERPCYVSVSLVSDEAIADMNDEWRGVIGPTDVISLECERPDDPDLPPDVPCELGDIVLAPSYIAEQASRYGTTPAQETTLLLIHGMLHLLGYDHLDEEDAVEMEAREDEILSLARPNDDVGHITLTRHDGEKR